MTAFTSGRHASTTSTASIDRVKDANFARDKAVIACVNNALRFHEVTALDDHSLPCVDTEQIHILELTPDQRLTVLNDLEFMQDTNTDINELVNEAVATMDDLRADELFRLLSQAYTICAKSIESMNEALAITSGGPFAKLLAEALLTSEATNEAIVQIATDAMLLNKQVANA